MIFPTSNAWKRSTVDPALMGKRSPADATLGANATRAAAAWLGLVPSSRRPAA
jgi:hypothetical protein